MSACQHVSIAGIEKIFAASIVVHGDEAKEDEVRTEAKLHRKIIVHCLKIAKANGIKLRRTFAKEIKQRKLEYGLFRPPKDPN